MQCTHLIMTRCVLLCKRISNRLTELNANMLNANMPLVEKQPNLACADVHLNITCMQGSSSLNVYTTISAQNIDPN